MLNLQNTQRLTDRLALFFVIMSSVIGLVILITFYAALDWSEDRMAERRMVVDRASAIERFIGGEHGVVQLDTLTSAYNDIDLLPEHYRQLEESEQPYLVETAESSLLVYRGHYFDQGNRQPLLVISAVDRIEVSRTELFIACFLVVCFVALLMSIFALLLHRLSHFLVKPINSLSQQLSSQEPREHMVFTVADDASQEFKLLTEKLNHYRRELHLSVKREQAFARYSSHEFRSALTVLSGANALLAKLPHTDKQARQIDKIHLATRQMREMVDALLSIVRYERECPSAAEHHSEQTFKAIIEANKALADHKHIDLSLNYVAGPTLSATPAVLQIVLGNLLRNAIAASDAGGVDMTVTPSEITVIDDGSGFNTKPSEQGHGLGLMIVEDICQRYHWQFSLSNTKDRGCEAKISFPHLPSGSLL
ncbi:sensor histidine kinase [Vibrio sp. WXL103]|uniref:sensor histidine kinase n=1 Tax=unclassified Vibrio TaxID=2614977 RepID=UPI003EC4ACDD